MPDVTPVKQRLKVPPELSSCHTAVVEGYIVQGHVPADDITRLLRQRPKVQGIYVPGMPIGSPGMEGPGKEVKRERTRMCRTTCISRLSRSGRSELFTDQGG